MKKIFLLFVMALTIQACSPSLDSARMANTKWVLSEWPGRTIPVNAQATLNFDIDHKINGKSFCNGYGGNSSFENGRVKFSEIFGTKMFCTEFGDAETHFQTDLQAVDALKMNGEKLQLLKDGQVMMVFVKAQ